MKKEPFLEKRIYRFTFGNKRQLMFSSIINREEMHSEGFKKITVTFLLAFVMQFANAHYGGTLPNQNDGCGSVINSLDLDAGSGAILSASKGTAVVNYFIDKDILQPEVLSNAIDQENEGVFHLFTHGKPGQLLIDSKWLGKEEIALIFDSHRSQLSPKLRAINIYACNFAQGDKGRNAVVYLEKATGLKIAASTNITGADGDWKLEVGDNTSALKVESYAHNLQSTIINVTTQLGSAGNLATLYDGNLTQQNFYFNNNQSYPGSNTEIFNITFSQPTIVSQLRILLDGTNSNSFLGNGVQYRVQGFGSSSWDNLTATITSNGTFTDVGGNEREDFDFAANATLYTNYRILWVNSTGGGQISWDPWIEEIQFTEVPYDACTYGASSGTVTADDLDADGINNACDLDDDNDGILDVDEGGVICPESTITNVTTGLSVGASSTADLIDGTYNNAFYFTDNQSYPVGNNEIFNIFFAAPIVVTEIRTVLDRTNSYLENGVNYKVQGFDGTSYINLTATLTSDGVAAGSVEIFDLSTNTTAYSNYRIFWVSGNQVGWAPYIHQIEVSIAPCDGSSGRDTDMDGVLDQLDLDSDNDGIADIIEAGGIDSDNDGVVDNNLDTDQDGWANTFDADNGGTALLLVDTDGDGFDNYWDLDSDSDGITDNVEGQTTLAFLAPLGVDTDGDGWDDRYDKDNGGTAIELSNNDGVDAPDYISQDSDGDGAPDHVEGFDDGGIPDVATDDMELRATAFESASGNPNKYLNSDDADSDGLADWMEDADSDGVPNFLDPQSTFYYDTDQDGLIDLYDLDNNGVASNLADQDGDGSPDFRDTDNNIGFLPIELISFTATKVGNVTELNWTTVTELNNDYFTIERTADGKTFEAILTHPGSGNSYSTRSYKMIDYKPVAGNNYYRLRQTDYDGRTELFNVVAVYFDVNLNTTIDLYPNPTEGAELNIEISGFDAGTYSLIVRSSDGRLIQTTSASVENSESVFQTQVLKKVQLPAGIYTLQMLGNRYAVTKLFIVK